MKLYHVNRSGHIKTGQTIELVKDFYNEITENTYYKDGLSSHGIRYFLSDVSNRDYQIDAIFDYERMLNYPNKLSRYTSLFAFDEKSVAEFIKEYNLKENYLKVFEIETEEFEKHNMNLVSGYSHCTMSKYAKLYWEDGKDPRGKEEMYEYLVKLPVKIGKEVPLSTLIKEKESDKCE